MAARRVGVASVVHEEPTLLALRYHSSDTWRSPWVIQPTPNVKVIDVNISALASDISYLVSPDGSLRPSGEEFREEISKLPHRALKLLTAGLEPRYDTDRANQFAQRMIRAELRHRQSAPPLRGHFVLHIMTPYRDHEFIPSDGVKVVDINWADYRNTSRIGHDEAAEKAASLPDSLKAVIKRRSMTGAQKLAHGPSNLPAGRELG